MNLWKAKPLVFYRFEVCPYLQFLNDGQWYIINLEDNMQGKLAIKLATVQEAATF